MTLSRKLPAAFLTVLFGTLLLLGAQSAMGQGLAAGFDAALESDARADEDKARDAARKPRAVLEFLGIGEGMTVLDVLASTGWYTEVLSAAVGPDGRVVAHNSVRAESRSGPTIKAKAERLGNVEPVFADLGELDLEVDAAITALNLHDRSNRDRAAGVSYLVAIHAQLRPGGVLGVIDHAGLAGQDNQSMHRMEAAVARELLAEAGFVVEAESDVLHNPNDDHTLNIRDESLARNTDRFVIRARKPE